MNFKQSSVYEEQIIEPNPNDYLRILTDWIEMMMDEIEVYSTCSYNVRYRMVSILR